MKNGSRHVRGLQGTAWRFALLLASVCLILSPHHAGAGTTTTAKVTLLRNQEYSAALIQSLRTAQSSIVLSYYLFKVSDIRGNLPGKVAEELVAARRRGVDVTVYLERRRGKDPLMGDNRRTAALLHRSGVRVLFDSPDVTTHTKAAVIDRRLVFLGSHNLTQGALRRNNELSVLIDSPDLAAEVLSYLDRL